MLLNYICGQSHSKNDSKQICGFNHKGKAEFGINPWRIFQLQ